MSSDPYAPIDPRKVAYRLRNLESVMLQQAEQIEDLKRVNKVILEKLRDFSVATETLVHETFASCNASNKNCETLRDNLALLKRAVEDLSKCQQNTDNMIMMTRKLKGYPFDN